MIMISISYDIIYASFNLVILESSLVLRKCTQYLTTSRMNTAGISAMFPTHLRISQKCWAFQPQGDGHRPKPLSHYCIKARLENRFSESRSRASELAGRPLHKWRQDMFFRNSWHRTCNKEEANSYTTSNGWLKESLGSYQNEYLKRAKTGKKTRRLTTLPLSPFNNAIPISINTELYHFIVPIHAS